MDKTCWVARLEGVMQSMYGILETTTWTASRGLFCERTRERREAATSIYFSLVTEETLSSKLTLDCKNSMPGSFWVDASFKALPLAIVVLDWAASSFIYFSWGLVVVSFNLFTVLLLRLFLPCYPWNISLSWETRLLAFLIAEPFLSVS